MSKVLVFDVAASTRGALTVLKSFYDAASDRKDIEWVFILSDLYVNENNSIKVVEIPEAKKGWIYRLWFDYVKAPALIRKENPDTVLSLQNITVPFCKKKRITFLHQSIPFADIRFSFVSNRIEWIYQNIISRFIYYSLRKSDVVAVQTEWIKEAVIRKLKISSEKVVVIPPTVNIQKYKQYRDTAESRKTFLYPSAYATYKNHRIIIEAVQILRKRGIDDFKVIFTIEQKEMPSAVSGSYNIECIGTIPYDELVCYYSSSVLIFPSLLETFGLPLAEAGIVGSRIIAVDRPFAHEILRDYGNVRFFDPMQAEQLAGLMEDTINNAITYEEIVINSISERYGDSNWEALIQLL